MEDAHFFAPVFPESLVSRCGETNSQVLPGRLSFGRGCSAGCGDNLEGHESGAFSGAGSAGRGEDTFDDFAHAFENSLVAGDAANALGDVDVAVAAARRGENNCVDHLLEFKNSLLAASAESVYALNCLNSLNSLICHPSMHSPSLARVFDVKNGGVSGMVSGEGVGRGSRGRDTARLDALLHDVIRSVPACGNPRIQGLLEYYDWSYARWSTSSNSRLERRPELRGGTKWSRRGSLCKVRQDAGELQEPQLEDFPGAGNQGKVCCVGVPSPDSFCHSCATWARQ